MVRNGKRRGNKNAVQNVRVLDDYSGQDGVKFDRVLSSMQNNHSQIRVLCTNSFPLVTSTNAYVQSQSHPFIRNTDDFISFAGQFETYRISMIRFDIYDINPANVTAGFFSTWHDDVGNASTITFTSDNVLDAPDSQTVPPGTGKITLVWRAKGTFENLFQSVQNAGGSPRDFGGIRYSVPAGSNGVDKYRVVVKAMVDFRGRN